MPFSGYSGIEHLALLGASARARWSILRLCLLFATQRFGVPWTGLWLCLSLWVGRLVLPFARACVFAVELLHRPLKLGSDTLHRGLELFLHSLHLFVQARSELFHRLPERASKRLE
jgi:hypothetical protein